MQILVTYDVSTETSEGRRRLRKVGIVCKDFGQRVQRSVFECSVNQVQYEQMRHRLLQVISEKEDSLRIYRLMEPKDQYLEEYGFFRAIDFKEPLMV
jgi:CRISPR-associated protein Cas2